MATPTHWNVAISFMLRRLLPSWISRGYGFRLGGATLLFLAWADDFVFVASGISQLKVMLTEFANLLHEYRLSLKETKCEWFANSVAWVQYGKTNEDMNFII